ncbi:hypothetical protein BU24DRAFT_418523 [Aaosphaeria arxii CBS 175.79]|uniref:Uncharacterized protein n=1 Tax=Aaosphaeria arxii CBS 175.79 TaxID=1450172 RepID=A0A6A5Y113_9PLEO|nr:uncharacterized protein BU24DRAFT_418523 [Aaosphaeria arxii CBS 175.79]KAF2018949.1 hypothetical protein BU24DRAFT_418523 [Aaosphaeria arxii CBS 175.79]
MANSHHYAALFAMQLASLPSHQFFFSTSLQPVEGNNKLVFEAPTTQKPLDNNAWGSHSPRAHELALLAYKAKAFGPHTVV